MKSKSNVDDKVASQLLRRLEELQQEQASIVQRLQDEFNRLSTSDGPPLQDDSVPMVTASAVPSTSAVDPFKPGVRVWIKKGTKHGGKGGIITSRRNRAGGIYWNVKLDNPTLAGKTDVYKKEESNLVRCN